MPTIACHDPVGLKRAPSVELMVVVKEIHDNQQLPLPQCYIIITIIIVVILLITIIPGTIIIAIIITTTNLKPNTLSPEVLEFLHWSVDV